jgi:hypothetical protein
MIAVRITKEECQLNSDGEVFYKGVKLQALSSKPRSTPAEALDDLVHLEQHIIDNNKSKIKYTLETATVWNKRPLLGETTVYVASEVAGFDSHVEG